MNQSMPTKTQSCERCRKKLEQLSIEDLDRPRKPQLASYEEIFEWYHNFHAAVMQSLQEKIETAREQYTDPTPYHLMPFEIAARNAFAVAEKRLRRLEDAMDGV